MKKLIVFVGTSGSGKTTLGNYLKSKGIPELVSHTTRTYRVGESEGSPYYFVTKEFFDKIEKVEESEYAGNHYCISATEVDMKLSAHPIVYTITNLHGYEQIKNYCAVNYPDIKVIMIYVDITLEVAAHRMSERGDTDENIGKRILKAVLDKELENSKYADYIVNNNGEYKDSIEQLDYILNKIKPCGPEQLAQEYGSYDLLAAYIMRTANVPVETAKDLVYSTDIDFEHYIEERIFSEED